MIKAIGDNTLSEILRDFKKFTAKAILKAIADHKRRTKNLDVKYF